MARLDRIKVPIVIDFIVNNFCAGEPTYLYIFFQGKGIVADLTIQDSDPNPTASIVAMDEMGNQTTFDDVPQWTSSDESVATVVADENGSTATINKTGAVGATLITVTSVRSTDGAVLMGTATLTVAPGEEASIELNLTPGVAEAAPAEEAPAASNGTEAPAEEPPAPEPTV